MAVAFCLSACGHKPASDTVAEPDSTEVVTVDTVSVDTVAVDAVDSVVVAADSI